MCFIRKKQINELQKRIDELTKIVKNNEFERLKARSEDLAVKDEQLGKIKIKVAQIVGKDTNTGQPTLTITYEIPKVTLYLDENGPYGDNYELFYAINRLDLISYQDMDKIRKAIDKEMDKVKN